MTEPIERLREELSEKERIRRILDHLSYDPDSGILSWKVNVNSRARKGATAGRECIDNGGNRYIRLTVDSKNYYAHRIAWLIHYGDFPKNCIDHIDGNGLNNKINNLRDVDALENNRNVRLSYRNKTGVCGVFFSKKTMKYESKIQVKNKSIYLIKTDDFFLAVCARKSAERKYCFHKNHGSIRPY